MGPLPHCRPELWQRLAAEIRIEVMKGIFDLPTLRNLLLANPPDRGLFNRYHREILKSVMSNMPTEVRESLGRVKIDRYDAAVPPEVLGTYRERLAKDEYGPGDPFPEDPYTNLDHAEILFSIAETAEDIESMVACFAKRRILLPSGHPHGQISPAETHRIRRAFWRFQVLHESRYRDELGEETGDKRYLSGRTWPNLGPDPGEHWLRRSTPSSSDSWIHCGSLGRWEVVELEAIREHLRAEVNSVQLDRHRKATVPDPIHRQPMLIQQLIKNLENWGTDPRNPSTDHLLVGEICRWNYYRRPTPTNAAHISIHETEFMNERQHSMQIHEQWGWCMFDRERLIRCGLLPKSIPHELGDRETRVRQLKLFEGVKRSHQECYLRLQNGLDSRIQAQFDADVALSKQLVMQSKELQSKQRLIEWVKPRDAALFERWTRLLICGTFDKAEQMQADLYSKKAVVMQSLENGIHRHSKRTTEEADLELLVHMREYNNAQRAVQERILAHSEQGLD